ncbi:MULTISPECIES: DUF4091 domain-containing protein [Paenibacillus]|uniref:DUF4091 domain-containing protein n=1 Tax=Paenibacillus TaxID=44249 RepID=UPI00048CABE0|nr:DUF4091 domain-containing protein [Paenibacillus sp. IHBB 10380]
MSNIPTFETRLLSSLSKVFADEELAAAPYDAGSAFLNETFSFQVAYRSSQLMKNIRVVVESELSEYISIRSVGLVPSDLPTYHDHDEFILRSTPGLYPDPLFPLAADAAVTGRPSQWRSLWVTVEPDSGRAGGTYDIGLRFETDSGEKLAEETFRLELIPAVLPAQTLIHTEWFHTDCLATYYGVDVFSERHWQLIEQYIRTAAEHGMNMMLTPLFTPPLDTEVGGERPTVQLVDVEVLGDGSYRFGFDKLDRWTDLCDRCGIQYLEFSHFFTQWGAKHAPKIVANVNGESQKLFGWETDASGEEYQAFLRQFIPALVDWIEDHGRDDRCYFHVSDEPHASHIEAYGQASRLMNELLPDYPIIDALSDFSFYEEGLVKRPIPASNHIEPFLEAGVEGLWTYYCCSQYKEVSNRFFNLPSARNRILGMQLYKYNIEGFLHWGYNFWYSQYSRRAIDPYRVTDADSGFPSGDAFLVYPGEDGPVESIRLKVFHEALQDLRALQLLEQQIGREAVLEALEEGLGEPITFKTYPRDEKWLLSKRQWINDKIKESMAVK